MMRDALQIYEQNEFQDLVPEEDPFYDKQEPILLGQAYYILEGLAFLMDNPISIPILATNNKIFGEVHINVVPCEEDGNEEIDEDQMTDEPMDLVNHTLDFKV